MASDGPSSGNKSANNSVRGDPRKNKSIPLFDANAEHLASQTQAGEIGPKRSISDVTGLRFNVRLDKADGTKQRVVAVVNQDGVILMDPSTDKGSDNLVAYKRFLWSSITSTQVSGATGALCHVVCGADVCVTVCVCVRVRLQTRI